MTHETHLEAISDPTPLLDSNDVLAQFDNQAVHSTDPYVRMLSRRIIQLTSKDASELNEPIRDTVTYSLQSHPFYRASDHTRSIERTLAAHQLWLGNRDFIQAIHTEEDWDDPLRNAYNGTDFEKRIFHAFTAMKVLANVGERAKFIKLEALLDDMPQPLKLIEIGTSQMHIGRKLALHRKKRLFSFNPVEVVLPLLEPHDPKDKPRLLREDSDQLSTVLQRMNYLQGPFVGIDNQIDPRDSMIIAKTEGDSAHLHERARANSSRLQEFRSLQRQQNLPGQEYHYADCSKPIDSEQFFAEHPDMQDGADIVFLSFVAYEIAPEDRSTLIENAFKLANPRTGKVMIVDNVQISPIGHMVFPEQQGVMSTTVTVFDNAKKRLGWQHRYTLETGRGKRFVTEPSVGNLALAGALGITPSRILAG